MNHRKAPSPAVEPPENTVAAEAPNLGRVAVFIPSYGDGGVERMMVNLARGFAQHGADVQFVVSSTDGPYLDLLGNDVRIVITPGIDRSSLPAFTREWLMKERPDVVLSAKYADDEIAINARDSSGVPTRVYPRVGTHMSGTSRMSGWNVLRSMLARRALERLYMRADGLICVSEGVANDLGALSPRLAPLTRVIRNPVITPELLASARADAIPDLADDHGPLIIAVGRFARVKRLDVLIRAFALARRERQMQLVLAGEGRGRAELTALAESLGVSEHVRFAGFLPNPYPLIAAADLLVLSSEREGSPNVLVEALALGTPVVATDCPSGPAEILQKGRVGRLVPVNEPEALADAMLATLAAPPDVRLLTDAVQDYHLAKSSAAYLKAFGLSAPAAPETPAPSINLGPH